MNHCQVTMKSKSAQKIRLKIHSIENCVNILIIMIFFVFSCVMKTQLIDEFRIELSNNFEKRRLNTNVMGRGYH